jgi:multidrug efflux pump subunit AcrA (membrane-fusion protein)
MSKNPQKTDSNDAEAQAALDAARLETERKRMLVPLAGQIAASIMISPSEKATSAKAIAEISVDVAEEILERIGF